MAATTPNDLVKKLLDAGAQFTDMTQQRAERLVKELTKSGEVRRKDAEKLVSDLVDRGRETTESIVHAVQRVVEAQMQRLGQRMDHVEAMVDEVAAKVGVTVPKRHTVKEAPVKKAPAKKAAAKKAPTKKAPAKKAPAKRAGTSTSGVRKVTTGRKSP
jgi:polyhydroxyalkanoate synthesis regulator phasin